MKKFICPYLVLLIFALLLAGCGPSEVEIATMTAAAWTPTPTHTPTPTPTPTPIPYDLTISVQDENGNLIDKASIEFPASGDDEPIMTDDSGKIFLTNLPGEEVSLSVSAQGYYDSEETTTIARGSNDISITMERDLLQILPSEACPAGQTALFIDDFEDGRANNIQGIGRPQFEFVTDPEIGTYVVGNENNSTEGMGEQFLSFPGSQENVVFHFDIVRPRDMQILWAYLRQAGPSAYIGVFSNDGNTWLQREPEMSWPSRFISRPDGLTWEHISVSVFEGAFDLWLNNELLLGVDDLDPIGPGTIAIVFSSHNEPLSFDNLVVCELSETYVPLEQTEE